MALLPYGKSRSLTPLETSLASKIFGSSIQYMRVKIHHGKYIPVQRDDTVMTPNGEIYFPTPLYKDDYSDSSITQNFKHLYIHEMVHVWQYQLGYPVKIAGLLESSWGHGYDYTLEQNTKLSDYPMEAQGNIIADYAMYLFFNQPTYYSRSYFGKPAYSLAELQAVLIDFINNPSDKGNLPKMAKSGFCEAEPNSFNCFTQ